MLFMKPAVTHTLIPPLIVNCVNEFTVCGEPKDIPLWITPKNMARSTAFIAYDPDGTLHEQYGRPFRRNNYRVKLFNPSDLEKSAKYNPLEYIKGDKDIPKLVTAILCGTKGRGKRGDIGFLSLESVLLTALIGFIAEEAPSRERNFATVIEMLNAMEPDTAHDDNDYKHAVDFLLDEAKKSDPKSLHVKRYDLYKQMAGHSAKAVVKSCAARLYPFGSVEAREYFSSDALDLNNLCSPRSAIFVTPGKSGAFDFIVPLMYAQLFDSLCEKSVQF